MNSTLVFWDIMTNGYRIDILDFISLEAILCGILVVISKNPVVSVLFLIGLFLCISGFLMILGEHFLALAYLLVYVGAVIILLVFILMLINVRVSELLSDTSKSMPLAIIISILFYTGVNRVYPCVIQQGNSLTSFVTSSLWDGNLAETSHITSIGNIMYTSNGIWLILTSLILLLAMVGSIVITINWVSDTRRSNMLLVKFDSEKFLDFIRSGICTFIDKLSIKYVIKTITSSIIFRVILCFIGFVLIYLGLTSLKVSLLLSIGIGIYYIYTFYKNKVKKENIPKIIFQLILSIVFIIIPFWLLIGNLLPIPLSLLMGCLLEFDPSMSASKGLTVFLGDYTLSMNPSPTEGGGNSSGGNPAGGSPAGGEPEGPSSEILKRILNKNIYPDSPENGLCQAQVDALRDLSHKSRYEMKIHITNVCRYTWITYLTVDGTIEFNRYLAAHYHWSNANAELAKHGYIADAKDLPLEITVMAGDKSCKVDFNKLYFKILYFNENEPMNRGKFILGEDVHTMNKNGWYYPLFGKFKDATQIPSTYKTILERVEESNVKWK